MMSDRNDRSPGSEGARRPARAGEVRYSIGELADQFGVTTRAIRFYEARGLLAPGRSGSMRSYTNGDRVRLGLILRGKNLGFSLEDIGEYLALYDADPAQEAQTKLLLTKVDAHIQDLQAKQADIERTLKELKEIRSQCRAHLKSDGRGSEQ
jgi:DNA-binding transcriptional MerR regulator